MKKRAFGGKKLSIKQMIKNMNMVRKAQIRMMPMNRPRKFSKTLSKLGTGGGFKQPWSERNLSKLNLLAPNSVKKLQNFNQMDVDKLLMRKDYLFDFQTTL